jgi:hypothetical protein
MGEPATVQPLEEARELRFVVTPRNLTRDQALRYLGWAPKFFDMLEKSGAIVGKRHGRNGAVIYSIEQLDEVDRKRAGAAANDDGGLDDDI